MTRPPGVVTGGLELVAVAPQALRKRTTTRDTTPPSTTSPATVPWNSASTVRASEPR